MKYAQLPAEVVWEEECQFIVCKWWRTHGTCLEGVGKKQPRRRSCLDCDPITTDFGGSWSCGWQFSRCWQEKRGNALNSKTGHSYSYPHATFNIWVLSFNTSSQEKLYKDALRSLVGVHLWQSRAHLLLMSYHETIFNSHVFIWYLFLPHPISELLSIDPP